MFEYVDTTSQGRKSFRLFVWKWCVPRRESSEACIGRTPFKKLKKLDSPYNMDLDLWHQQGWYKTLDTRSLNKNKCCTLVSCDIVVRISVRRHRCYPPNFLLLPAVNMRANKMVVVSDKELIWFGGAIWQRSPNLRKAVVFCEFRNTHTYTIVVLMCMIV